MKTRTQMVVVAGSLGSGKTTLLRRLLTADLGRVALIVNEFGELGIDGQVLEGEHYRLIELPGGCVCCSLAGEFAAAVAELVAGVAPDLILVETTGVAEADALVLDIEQNLPQIRLDAAVVVVDADTCCRFPELGYAERSQIGVADLLLLNKIDLVTPAQRAAVRARLRQVNANAALVETTFADLDPALVAGPHGDRPQFRPLAGAPGTAMESFAWEAGADLEGGCFAAAVAGWPAQVYRAKGFVRIDGELCLFNYVAGRWQLEPAAGGRPGLVFIGPGLAALQEGLNAGLQACSRAL
ncbi:MAG: GTP-binding protein [Candidatus Latescibacteria bacterium]|nr:GTP-binding protein [Candidatus Latescibacterota bacterium]